MVLKLKPSKTNSYPLTSVLIRGNSLQFTLRELQRMKLNWKQVELYAIPGNTANSIWGFFAITQQEFKGVEIEQNELCQKVNDHVYIAEKTVLFPFVTSQEMNEMCKDKLYIIHPDFGLFELKEKIQLHNHLKKPVEKSFYCFSPEAPSFIPQKVRSFQIHTVSADEVLENLEASFPKHEKMEDQPLSTLERLKLGIYKALFKQKAKTDESQNNQSVTSFPVSKEPSAFMQKVESFFDRITNKSSKMGEKMMKDMEALEKRNLKKIDKFLDMLEKDLENALKFAIPLDVNGSGRGGDFGELDFSGHSRSGAGGFSIGDDHFFRLQEQYRKAAQELVLRKDYQKAAFVYIKLLKDHHSAANTLQEGKYYKEAATIHLKHTLNKEKAAECFEQGNMISNAIEIHKELSNNEKVGDLYTTIHKKNEAAVFYNIVIDNYAQNNQFVKAALIHRNKLYNPKDGQELLMQGWEKNMDAENCLSNYLHNIEDEKKVSSEIQAIYSAKVSEQNSTQFLNVIEKEFKKSNQNQEMIQDLAFEIVAKKAVNDPKAVHFLKSFKPKDKEFSKDAMRFSLKKK
jgi:MoxR-vWA-beta-propeller ternary system domain bpX3